MNAAAKEQCAAAIAHAAKHKEDVYGPLCDEAGIKFVAIVFEVFGAVSPDGLALLKTVACKWGKRRNLLPCRSIPMVLQRFSMVLAKFQARAIMRCDPATYEEVPYLEPQ